MSESSVLSTRSSWRGNGERYDSAEAKESLAVGAAVAAAGRVAAEGSGEPSEAIGDRCDAMKEG